MRGTTAQFLPLRGRGQGFLLTSPPEGEVGGASPPGGGESGDHHFVCRATFKFFIAVAFLALPIFAHGCHGDDLDHEPLLIPTRLNSEDR